MTVAPLVAALVLALASPAPGAATDPTCANPAIPPAIVIGPLVAASPLPVETARAGGVELHVAVAGDEKTRELGLMCVLRLKPQHGMIFVFPGGDIEREFWMKNTLVPLDMIWVRGDGTVDTVAANVPASTRTTPDAKVARRAGKGSYVIELAGGEAAADGIVKGTKMTLPVP